VSSVVDACFGWRLPPKDGSLLRSKLRGFQLRLVIVRGEKIKVVDVCEAVLNALYWDAAIPRDRLSVTFESGWVTLTGEVDHPYEKSCAEAIGVKNQIAVHPTISRSQRHILS
jgi:BON domain